MLSRRKLIFLLPFVISAAFIPVSEVYADFIDAFDVSTEEANPTSVEFNTDGMKMFVLGRGGNEVNEYACSTGFDVSTCSFTVKAGNPFSISAQEENPISLAFSTDGKTMFVMGILGDDINEYACTTGFDVSTCAYSGDGERFSVLSQDSNPRSLAFNTAGTKMFMMGIANKTVNEYACGTGFDVSTCAYSGDGERFSVSGQEVSPSSLAFNTDGTKMFVYGFAGKDVNEYACSTGFDVSTCAYSGDDERFDPTAQEDSPRSLTFNADGTKMFVMGFTGVDVNEYSCIVGFDVSTCIATAAPTLTLQDPSPQEWGVALDELAGAAPSNVGLNKLVIEWNDGSGSSDVTISGTNTWTTTHTFPSTAISATHGITLKVVEISSSTVLSQAAVTVNIEKQTPNLTITSPSSDLVWGGAITMAGSLTNVAGDPIDGNLITASGTGIGTPSITLTDTTGAPNPTGEYSISILSGRDEKARQLTEDWLRQYGVTYDWLFMRPSGNNQKDCLFKCRIYINEILPHYEVEFVLDDRDQVVAFWRSIGLTCFQVDYGAF